MVVLILCELPLLTLQGEFGQCIGLILIGLGDLARLRSLFGALTDRVNLIVNRPLKGQRLLGVAQIKGIICLFLLGATRIQRLL
jgi:hypothetical protein